jgi:RNA polymerase sigma-70 factor (ECF subfamily)
MPYRSTAGDEELVERARQAPAGDLRAFEALVERHKAGVMANCRYLSGSSADAEDLAQEVFLKAFYGLPRFEGRSKFKTWLQRIKVNHCLNFLKRKKNKTFVDAAEPALEGREEMQVAPVVEAAMDAAVDRARIRQVLDAMADSLRIPLLMRDMDELSYQEVADALGIGLSAAKMRIKRGREEFRRLYHQSPEGAEPAEGDSGGRAEEPPLASEGTRGP